MCEIESVRAIKCESNKVFVQQRVGERDWVRDREGERGGEREIKKNKKLNCVRKLKCQVRDILE
jgi:hypothetical protein